MNTGKHPVNGKSGGKTVCSRATETIWVSPSPSMVVFAWVTIDERINGDVSFPNIVRTATSAIDE